MNRILITGANRGLGYALTAFLADRGKQVIAACRDPSKAHTLERLRQRHDSITILPIDVDNESSIASARAAVGSMFESIDLLVNNAAVLHGDTALTMNAQTMLDTYRTNTVGPVLVIRHFLDLLRKSLQPAIVTISSEAGSLTRYQGSTHICSYACSKSALNMAMRCMAHELADTTGNRRWYIISERIRELVQESKPLPVNVDFYSATVYYSLGIPTDLFTPIFAIARMSGWTAHVLEQLADNRLFRPLSAYTGPEVGRTVTPIEQR